MKKVRPQIVTYPRLIDVNGMTRFNPTTQHTISKKLRLRNPWTRGSEARSEGSKGGGELAVHKQSYMQLGAGQSLLEEGTMLWQNSLQCLARSTGKTVQDAWLCPCLCLKSTLHCTKQYRQCDQQTAFTGPRQGTRSHDSPRN